jgi:hypothetical protein
MRERARPRRRPPAGPVAPRARHRGGVDAVSTSRC